MAAGSIMKFHFMIFMILLTSVFYLYQSYKRFTNFIFFLLESAFCFIISLLFSCFKLTDFCFYFLFPPCFGFMASSFFMFLEVGILIPDLRTFLFSNVSICCYEFPFQHWFICVPHILLCQSFIFLLCI